MGFPPASLAAGGILLTLLGFLADRRVLGSLDSLAQEAPPVHPAAVQRHGTLLMPSERNPGVRAAGPWQGYSRPGSAGRSQFASILFFSTKAAH